MMDDNRTHMWKHKHSDCADIANSIVVTASALNHCLKQSSFLHLEIRFEELRPEGLGCHIEGQPPE